MTATVELPYEIWLHIFHFLKSETIRQLRFVNTLLYNLSLDELHRITQIGYIYPVDIASLRDPRNSRRVRVLRIWRGPIYPQGHESSGALGSSQSLQRLIGKFSRIRHDPKTDLDRLLDAVPGLTNLTTLDVYLSYSSEDPFHSTKIKFLNAAWNFFSANLMTLSLDVPLEEVHLVIPHITLPLLKSFSIVLDNHYQSEPNELIRGTLLPFLIKHSSTLQSLKLAALKNIDTSSILAHLPHMPYLRNLDISHPFLTLDLTILRGHHLFLEAHQSQLQHLRFDFAAQSSPFALTDEFFNQEWCHVLLPELQSLSFCLSRFEVCCEAAAIPYFQRQIPPVKHLKVLSLCFSYNQMASIIKGSGGYQLMALRTLDMQIWCFSPDLLILLADRAPQLQSLKLAVIVIGPDKQPEPIGRNRVPEFCKALQSKSFPYWGLYDMILMHRHGSPVPPSLRNQCKVALFHTFPNLKEFCGLGPNESWPEEQEMEMTSVR